MLGMLLLIVFFYLVAARFAPERAKQRRNELFAIGVVLAMLVLVLLSPEISDWTRLLGGTALCFGLGILVQRVLEVSRKHAALIVFGYLGIVALFGLLSRIAALA